MGKRERKRRAGRPRRKEDDNIRMDLMGCGGVDWVRSGTGGELL
jgi:hypothetical protein